MSGAPAGFWRRYAAYSLDFAILATVSTLLAWSRITVGWQQAKAAAGQLSNLLGRSLADALMQGTPPAQLSAALLADARIHAAAEAVQAGILGMLLPWLLAYALLAALYHVGFERSRWQGSPGKRALRLEVVVAGSDMRPSLARTLVRHGAGALSWLTLNLGHALAAVPPQKRALHDYIAGARVVCAAGEAPLPLWARAWLALQLLGGFALVAWLLLRYVAALQAATQA